MHILYTKIKDFVIRRATILKLLFVLSVLVFVVAEIGRSLKGTDWSRVGADLASRSPLDFVIMLVCGLIAVSPMLIYDFTIVEFLPGKFSKKYIIKSGWITNTLTNIAGFGGFLGAAMRATFYKDRASRQEILYAISKIALFLLSGLSVLSWVALLDIYFLHDNVDLHQYWFWLLLSGLYFPFLFIVTRFKDNKFFHDLNSRQSWRLVLGSTLEWGFVALFFLLIGKVLGVDNHLLLYAFPLYIIASVLGIISMIPGGLGSFDVFMLLELVNLGIPKETILVWIIYFRIFYYFVPVALGIFLFLHNMGAKVNTYFDGIPAEALSRFAHSLITLFLYFSGIFMFMESAVPELTIRNKFLVNLYPLTFLFIHQLTNIFFAFALLGLARGIYSRVKKAYLPTLVFVVIGILNTLYQNFNLSLIVYLGIVLTLLLLSSKSYYRKQLQYSWGAFWVDGLIFGGGFILYVLVGVINRPKFTLHHHVPTQLFFPDQRLWFSGLIGIALAVLVLVAIIHYLTHGEDPFVDEKPDLSRAQAVIANFGGNETSHLAFLGDKNLFFYQAQGQDQVFFMYRKTVNKLVIMGEPVGNSAYFEVAIEAFLEKADLYDYELVFYEVGEDLTMLLHSYGFDFIKDGEDAWLNLADFTLTGKKMKGTRALINKFDREGYQFEIWQPPFSPEAFAKLKTISDSWLEKQAEKGFSLGFFSENYLNQAPIAVVSDAKGEPVAFATLMPTGSKKILTIDLMRHNRQTAPSGIMDEVFVSLFRYGQEEGYQQFYLGMAPLANVGQNKFSFLGEQIAHFIYEYGHKLYGFQGLRNYKNKFATSWHAKYIAYQKKSILPSTMLQLVLLINQRADQKPRRLKDFIQR
ncbi:bifunctional lysylphosphatidylglycerol flippase/synthetase MprF [Ligilactobacillus equi]